MLITVKMPPIDGILTFMSMLSLVEYEKCFITSGPDTVLLVMSRDTYFIMQPTHFFSISFIYIWFLWQQWIDCTLYSRGCPASQLILGQIEADAG